MYRTKALQDAKQFLAAVADFADMQHLPKLLVDVKAETNEPHVRNREAYEIRTLAVRPAGALQRKSSDAHALGLEPLEVLLQLDNSQACVDNVLEDQHILALQATQVVTDNLQFVRARGAGRRMNTQVVLIEGRFRGVLVVRAQLGKVMEKGLEKAASAFQQAKAVELLVPIGLSNVICHILNAIQKKTIEDEDTLDILLVLLRDYELLRSVAGVVLDEDGGAANYFGARVLRKKEWHMH